MINTVSKKYIKTLVRIIERGIVNQPLWQCLGWPRSYVRTAEYYSNNSTIVPGTVVTSNILVQSITTVVPLVPYSSSTFSTFSMYDLGPRRAN